MTKEDYYLPRYECVSIYPFHYWQLGDIISFKDKEDTQPLSRTPYYCDIFENFTVHNYPSSEFDLYPLLFKRLYWWEHLDANSMPDYVKLNPDNTIGGDRVFKVLDVITYLDGFGLVIDEEKENGMGCKYLLPADEQDYIDYIKSLKP